MTAMPILLQTQNTSSEEPIAILEPEELDRLKQLTALLDAHQEKAQKARVALENARRLLLVMENQRAQIWQQICDIYKLDPEADFFLDGTGRVFRKF